MNPSFNVEKNIAKGTFNEVEIDKDFFVLTYQNESGVLETLEREMDSSFIQFHYCVKGSSKFVFNEGRYVLDIQDENSLLLYNPQRDLPIHLIVNPHSWMVSVLISIKKFHSLFSQEADYITFLSDDNKDKKYYKDGKM